MIYADGSVTRDQSGCDFIDACGRTRLGDKGTYKVAASSLTVEAKTVTHTEINDWLPGVTRRALMPSFSHDSVTRDGQSWMAHGHTQPLAAKICVSTTLTMSESGDVKRQTWQVVPKFPGQRCWGAWGTFLSKDRSQQHITDCLKGKVSRMLFVGCLFACLTSQQHASVSQGQICSDNSHAATLTQKLQIKLST